MTSGEIFVGGKRARIRNPKDAMRHGIALIPEDRKLEGLFLEESLRFNVSAATMERRAVAGLIKENEEKKVVGRAAESVQIDTSGMEHLVKLLSGGNQQKVVIAKTILVNAEVRLLDEPTRGVDIGTREEIYEIIKELVKEGKSIVLVSSDWEELFYLSDRLVVMSEGRKTGELDANEAMEEEVLHLSTLGYVKEKSEISRESAPPKRGLLSLFSRGGPEGSDKLDRESGFVQKFMAVYRKNNNVILISILAVMVIVGAITEPAFISWFNIRNMMGQMMPYFLLTLNPPGALLGIVVMLLFGLVIGAANALLVVKAKVEAFVVTLGMSIILTGITLVITKNPIGPSPKILRQIVNGAVGGVPYVLFIIVGLIVVFTILLRYMAIGRHFYAVGENPKGAFWAGLPVQKTQIVAFMISSFMAVLAGIFMQGRTGAADPAP